MNESTDISASIAKSSLDLLAEKTGSSWRNLDHARTFTQQLRQELGEMFKGLDTGDTSIVVFGSLARDEATSKSDTDWTLLVDGIADPQHVTTAQEIKRRVDGDGKSPGQEGTFGSLAFSHEILNFIGGADDSNANTTRRMLLLLESKPLGRPEAWDRVINNVLSRYLTEDRGLWMKTNERGVPLFLLNDIARFWRIMVVDFAYKQRMRGNSGYALRNIKLGLSRKLIYVAGLVACFSCHLDFPQEHWQTLSVSGSPQLLIEHLRTVFRRTPLEILAGAVIRYDSLLEPSKRLFGAYDSFIGLMASEQLSAKGQMPKDHLENLEIGDLDATLYTKRRGRSDKYFNGHSKKYS